MQLEDYFDFLSTDDIRVKGHRIGIETILLEYLDRARTAEQIAEMFPSLSLEHVYATILHFLHNRLARKGVGFGCLGGRRRVTWATMEVAIPSGASCHEEVLS